MFLIGKLAKVIHYFAHHSKGRHIRNKEYHVELDEFGALRLPQRSDSGIECASAKYCVARGYWHGLETAPLSRSSITEISVPP